ncbi:hypothetical protein ID866_7525 [Astraeus odoratus]|nr:hypothetical protein ID866_7525 [Astraeus odoratus]
MIIRLTSSFPHRCISYELNFPCVLPFPDLPLPAAWTAQSSLLTSAFQLENAANIHVFDKAAGLVARIQEVELDVPQKEITVSFIDGRSTRIAMNPDCARMLDSVADDVRAFNEADGYRSSLEGSTCDSTASSTDDLHSLNGANSLKPPKSAKHKRQRSLLFSLISSLVPKALSLPSRPSSPNSVPSAPPQSPLPPPPGIPSRQDCPSPPPQQVFFPPPQSRIHFLRARARATLIDAWRLHIQTALSPEVPQAGYIEWVLCGIANKVRAEVQEHKRDYSQRHDHVWKAKHGRSQSEGRNAIDLGERSNVEDLWHLAKPFPVHLSAEMGEERVVYPRRDQANEWGVRIRSESPDELDAYAFEVNGNNESLINESFGNWDGQHDPYEDAWDDNERFMFDVGGLGPQHALDVNKFPTLFDEAHVHFQDTLTTDYGDEDPQQLEDTAFHFSAPVTPSNVNEDDDSDESQPSPRTPEENEELPLSIPSSVQPGSQDQLLPPPVSRTSSSRPRPRPRSFPSSEPAVPSAIDPPSKLQTQTRSTASQGVSTANSSISSVTAWSPKVRFKSRRLTADEFIADRLEYLRRVQNALSLVRTRAQEEGWRLVRASVHRGPTAWTESDGDRALETKAKRRAWSSGVKVSAPYTRTTYQASSSPTFKLGSRSEYFTGGRVWDGKVPLSVPSGANQFSHDTPSAPLRPPGLSQPPPKTRSPIAPTGISLGKPLYSSPLALHVWTAHDLELRQDKYGILSLRRIPESLMFEKRAGPGTSFVSFPESPTRTVPESPTHLFPVCEEEDESESEVDRPTEPCIDHPSTLISQTEVECVEATAGTEGAITVAVVEILEDNAGTTTPTPSSDDDPFSVSVRPRTRTTSMYSPSTSSTACIPLTPPPSYQAATSQVVSSLEGSIFAQSQSEKLDTSSVLRPLSGLSVSAPSTPVTSETARPRRPPLTSNPNYVPKSQEHQRVRPRSISLPAALSLSLLAPAVHSSASAMGKRLRSPSASSRAEGKDDRTYEDLSPAYIAPPPSPSGPINVSAIPAPHEQQQYPKYAHIAQVAHAPAPTVPIPGLPTMSVGATRSAMLERRSVSGPAPLGSNRPVLTAGDTKGKTIMRTGIPGGLDDGVTFQGGGGDAGIEVSICEVALELGRTEEGRVVW